MLNQESTSKTFVRDPIIGSIRGKWFPIFSYFWSKWKMMKIKLLIENTAFQTKVAAEHGLSILIEENDRRIVFDTGQTDAFLRNSKIYELDPDSIESIVLSHGHYDHTGGLASLLQVNKHAKVYAKSTFRLFKSKTTGEYIGTPNLDLIPQKRIEIVNQRPEILPNVFIMPNIEIFDEKETHFTHFKIKEGDEMLDDRFDDELYLAIVKDKELSIISGCAHRGITNILRSAQKEFGLPIRLILGGLHTSKEPDEEVISLAETLDTFHIKDIYVCHCTGIDKYAILKQKCKANVHYASTGVNIFL
jgi:7,8-dihydropterin-6-yl-methyl-4-(beta-D-ribofuranosyl)aminobenzene 5'-phosphate synthase